MGFNFKLNQDVMNLTVYVIIVHRIVIKRLPFRKCLDGRIYNLHNLIIPALNRSFFLVRMRHFEKGII